MTPYQSTIKFCDWLERINCINAKSELNILDAATGKGANIYYMKKRYPNCKYVGIDINTSFISDGNNFFQSKGINDCSIEYADLFNLNTDKFINQFEGIVCYQTLSWLPEYKIPLISLLKLNPEWIAMSSLFYDGLVDCSIEIKEYSNSKAKHPNKSSFYNIYSLPRIKDFFHSQGFKIFLFCPFNIEIDLPKPKHSLMQTYTQTLIDGKRIQISGPLLMSWYFVCALRS